MYKGENMKKTRTRTHSEVCVRTHLCVCAGQFLAVYADAHVCASGQVPARDFINETRAARNWRPLVHFWKAEMLK